MVDWLTIGDNNHLRMISEAFVLLLIEEIDANH